MLCYLFGGHACSSILGHGPAVQKCTKRGAGDSHALKHKHPRSLWFRTWGQIVLHQTLHRVATKEREEIKRTTKQKMARRHNKEGGNHLEQESNRQRTMEDIDGGLYPAVDGQSLGER